MHRRDALKAAGLASLALAAAGPTALTVVGSTPEPDATPQAGDPALLLVRWELASLVTADGSTLTPAAPSRHTFQLIPDGQVWVVADCNVGGGTWHLDGSSVTLSAMRTTLVACDAPSIGDEFSAALVGVERYAITTDASDQLQLLTGDGATLTFAPSPRGVRWQFARFQGGNGAEVVPDNPARYTLEIGDDDSVIVVADCNRGKGTATIDESSIELRVGLTRMACGPGSIGADFARYLEEAVSWVIRDGQLHLSLPMDAGIASFDPTIPVEEDGATPGAD